MHDHVIQQSMDQPGKVANLARDQLNREGKMRFSLRPLAPENLVSGDRFGHPAPACSFSTLRLAVSSTYHGIPPNFRSSGVHQLIYIATGSSSLKFIGSLVSLPMVSTTKSPSAQGQ